MTLCRASCGVKVSDRLGCFVLRSGSDDRVVSMISGDDDGDGNVQRVRDCLDAFEVAVQRCCRIRPGRWSDALT
jgi:hypothetical protein